MRRRRIILHLVQSCCRSVQEKNTNLEMDQQHFKPEYPENQFSCVYTKLQSGARPFLQCAFVISAA